MRLKNCFYRIVISLFVIYSVSVQAQVFEKKGTFSSTGMLQKIIFSNLHMDNSGNKALIAYYAPFTTSYYSFYIESIHLIDIKTQIELMSYTYVDNRTQFINIDDLFKVVDYNGDGFDDVLFLNRSAYTIFSLSEILGSVVKQESQISVSQNVPNPFNEQTEIKYSLLKDDYVSIRIFDMNGNEITSMINYVMTAGDYSVLIKDAKLVSGTYLYQVQVGNDISVKKMIKI